MSDIKQSRVETFQRCFTQNPGKYCTLIDIYLLIAFIKFQAKLKQSMQQILRLSQLNLFEKRDIMALLSGDPPINKFKCDNQLILF